MFRKLILLGTLCCLSTPAFATEADFEKKMARGAVALETGDFVAAQAEYREAVKEHPTDPEAALYLAVALNRTNAPETESALKNALRLDPNNPRINLELGAFFYNSKLYEEASDYLETLLTLKPADDIREAGAKYLANIRGQSAGKRWGITLSGGMQYDTNVTLAADPTLLPVGSDRMGDWKGLINLGLNGIAYQDSRQELTGSYSLYQSLHLHLQDFNLTQNALDVTYKRRLSSLYSAKLSTDVESILLGGKQFVNDYSITPGALVTFDSGINLGLDYRFRKSFFKNSDTYATNTERNGTIHSIIFSYRHPLSETLILRGGYTFDRELTTVSVWSSSAHSGSAGLTASLPHAFMLDINAETTRRKYDDILAGASERRSDTTGTGGVALIWQASGQLSLSLDYKYSKNVSNIDGYSYTRGITTLMLNGRY
jgi:tetratricopeptide (TPR) repeat protein